MLGDLDRWETVRERERRWLGVSCRRVMSGLMVLVPLASLVTNAVPLVPLLAVALFPLLVSDALAPCDTLCDALCDTLNESDLEISVEVEIVVEVESDLEISVEVESDLVGCSALRLAVRVGGRYVRTSA